MTESERRTAIMDLIEKHTAANTVSREVARASLIGEGIYTKAGKLKAAFGGRSKKAKSAD
jgi:hypothetical protein